MAGLRQLLPLIPPLVTAQLSISNPTTAITDCRIDGSKDLLYGTLGTTDGQAGSPGWVPRLDGSPFCVIAWQENIEHEEFETWRIHAEWTVELFVAVAHANDPAVLLDYNDLTLAWDDAARMFIAANRRLSPSADVYTQFGSDIIWRKQMSRPVKDRAIHDTQFAGVSIMTNLQMIISVNYQ